jgi:hypothetical protein
LSEELNVVAIALLEREAESQARPLAAVGWPAVRLRVRVRGSKELARCRDWTAPAEAAQVKFLSSALEQPEPADSRKFFREPIAAPVLAWTSPGE